jgi:very-short-patch-repair endonuclease
MQHGAQRTSVLESLGFVVVRVLNPECDAPIDGMLEMVGRMWHPLK